jgi:hypothetical protein
MSLEPLLADPVFPQLRIAGDPESMREVFQKNLRSLGVMTYHVLDCHLSRIRYRKGARCVLQYTLRLAEAGTGHERIQCVTGVMYAKGVTRRKWEKLRLLDLGKTPEALSTFEPFSFIPDLGMLVEVFPFDRRLRTLPLLMGGPSPELKLRLLAEFGPGNWHAEAWTVEPLRYRPELRATLRLTLRARDDTTARSEEKRFYAKVYRDEKEGERTCRALQALRSRADEDGRTFTVGRPIAYLSSLRVLLQEETPGTSLEDILLREEDATLAVRKAAECLAAMHLDHVPAPRRHTVRDEIAALERAGRILRWTCPHLQAKIGETVVAGLQDVPPAPTHRDLKLDHILLDGDRPALLDLDDFAEADPVLDTANFLAHLGGMRFRFPLLREDRWQTAAHIFAEEYFAHVPEVWRVRLSVHYAGAVLKMAVGCFQRQESDWPERIATLAEEASSALAGKIW